MSGEMRLLASVLLGFSQLIASAEVAPVAVPPSVEQATVPDIQVWGQQRGKSLSDFVPTVSELSGLKLESKKQATWGETLSREAGVSASSFGPGASRPVIRGLEGERVRVLQDGVGTLDASGASQDHAVSSDPLLAERVEIVRGSAALLYGSSAIGGVVNVINGRIPDELPPSTRLMLNTRGSSADWGRSGGAVVRTRMGRFSLRADGSLRGASDVVIPGFARSERLRLSKPLADGEQEVSSKLLNSGSQAYDAALGASYVGDSGHVGAALSTFGTRYGTVVEPDATIDLGRYRLDVGGELRSDGPVRSLRVKAAGSSYQHQELEGAEVGTTFKNQAGESRVDLKHAPIAGLEGIVGFQQQYSRLEATGAEAFLPTTVSTGYALFAYEELPLGPFTPTLGLRMDYSGVLSQADSVFGPGASRSFWLPSASAGLLYHATDTLTLGLQAGVTQRAPNYQELFANGPHLASGTFEVGRQDLAPELGRSLEVSLRHKTGTGEGRISVFAQGFSGFIALSPTGAEDAASSLPIYRYTPVEALLLGAELEYRQRLPWNLAGGVFEAGLTLDFVRGLNMTDMSNLPRITPVRETLVLGYRSSLLSAQVEAQRSEAQSLVASSELPTDAYVLIHLGAEVPIHTPVGRLSLIGRLNNLLDVEARNHVSLIKDLSPMPGRSFVLGLQARI